MIAIKQIMILRQTHQSPQKTIWKKLRLIRKCVFCRKEGQRGAAVLANLKKWDNQANASGQFISLTIINNSLNKINTEYNHANDSETKSSTNGFHGFLEKYYSKEKSKKQLHSLAYYYRYYGHKPTLVAPQMFSFMIQYRNKKKMLEYYRIQTLYSPQKSTKGSIKMKKNVRMVQQFLNMIEESKINLSRFSYAVAGQHITPKKTLREIDDEYNFTKSGQIYLDGLDHKLSRVAIQKKKKSSTKTKKHHKSCDIITGSEKKDNTRNDKLEKKGLKRRKGLLSQELERHQKLQHCISKLKAQIKREKQLLKKNQTRIKTKKPKHKPQKDKSIKTLKK